MARTCEQILTTSSALLKRYDVNKNGKIDPEEAAQMQIDWVAKKITDQDMLDIAEFNQMGCVIPQDKTFGPIGFFTIILVAYLLWKYA